MNKCFKVLKTIKRSINSSILCIRFPFLYPRNRFTGRHYTNWHLESLVNRLKPISKDEVWWSIKEVECMPKGLYKKGCYINCNRYSVHEHLNTEGTLTSFEICGSGKPIAEFTPTDLLNKGVIYSVCLDSSSKMPKLELYVSKGAVFKTDFNRFSPIVLAEDRVLKSIIKLINVWYDALSFFHCIPTYTELDAMDIGWRKAFGIKMCKDIKSALLKDSDTNSLLFSYRITQIKEKFGTLNWYDANTTKGVQEVICKYEEISSRTCISCGKPATKLSTGYICPYCDDCIGNRYYTEIKR